MKEIARFWPVGLFLALLGLAASAVFIQSATAKPSPLKLPTARIVYLVPDRVWQLENTPETMSTFQQEGVTLVHDFKSLEQEIAKNPPDVIMAHAASLPQAEAKWVRDQFQAGIIIVGMNVSQSELWNWVGYRNQEATVINESWYKKPYYSYVGRKTTEQGGVEAGGTNNINAKEGTWQQFFFALRLAVRDFEGLR